jgi:hypothetical protein
MWSRVINTLTPSSSKTGGFSFLTCDSNSYEYHSEHQKTSTVYDNLQYNAHKVLGLGLLVTTRVGLGSDSRVGRAGWAGRKGRVAGLAGRAGRKGWQEGQGGRVGRKGWQGWLGWH